jgi:hypothetical protein
MGKRVRPPMRGKDDVDTLTQDVRPGHAGAPAAGGGTSGPIGRNTHKRTSRQQKGERMARRGPSFAPDEASLAAPAIA